MSAIDELESRGEAHGNGASLLEALVIAARHRGTHLSATQLRRDHRIGPGGPTPVVLLDIARANGLRAAANQLTFVNLMQMGSALPAILLLRNGSAMVLVRVEPNAQPPHVVVQDPAAGQDALLSLDEQRLAMAWSG